MGLISLETLQNTCAGDRDMMEEMLKMGRLSVTTALTDIDGALAGGQWDLLARAVHKVRPVLSYFGIGSLNDDLLVIERNARERKDVAALPAMINAVTARLKDLLLELEQQLAGLHG